MNKLNPRVVGSAQVITAAIVYRACTTAFAAWPGGMFAFFIVRFQGLDSDTLKAAKPLKSGVFFHGLSGTVASTFAVGTVFAVSYNLVRLCPGCR